MQNPNFAILQQCRCIMVGFFLKGRFACVSAEIALSTVFITLQVWFYLPPSLSLSFTVSPTLHRTHGLIKSRLVNVYISYTGINDQSSSRIGQWQLNISLSEVQCYMLYLKTNLPWYQVLQIYLAMYMKYVIHQNCINYVLHQNYDISL